MNEKFLKLSLEKQEKLLKAICEEFTEHNYEDASTNRIVEKAGVSKGTLFNYFGCKESLYHDLLRYGLEFFSAYMVEFETGDFIERCRILAEQDMRVYQESPHMLNLFAKVYLSDQSHLPTDIKESIDILLNEALEGLFEGVDYTLFRTDVDPILLMRMIRYTFDGYVKEITQRMQNEDLKAEVFDQLMEEHDQMLQEMKKIYYRTEVWHDVAEL